MSKNIYNHNYTYLITNTTNDMMYIGVRSCNCLPEDDNYMGSSKYLNEAMLSNNIFVKEIIADYKHRESAILDEISLHEIYNVGKNESFYNNAKQTSTGFDVTGSPVSKTTIEKVLETKRKNDTLNTNTPAMVRKMLKTRKKNGTLNVTTPETIARGIATRKQNGTTSRSSECIAKILETRRKNGTLNTATTESTEKGLATKKKNGTLNNSKLMVETKRKNGTLNSWTPENTEETSAKSVATRKKNGFDRWINAFTPDAIAKAKKSRAETLTAKRKVFLGICIYKAYYNL